MPKRITPKKYLNVLGKIEIKKIAFRDIKASLQLENIQEEEIHVDAQNEVKFFPDEKTGTLLVFDEYKFLGKSKGKDVFEIILNIVAVISTKTKLDNSFLELFEQNTLKVITYPYVRHEVQNLTAKMGLTPFSLPMWRVPIKGDEEYLKPASGKDRTSNN